MIRIKRGNVAKKARIKILSLAKGYKGTHSKLFRIANQQVIKALKYNYIGRKNKKRIFRTIWIIRINSVAKMYNLNYSKLIHFLKLSKVYLNRKMLSQMAILDLKGFKSLLLNLN